MIELININKQLGDFKLENISFAVPSGKYAVLMGKTGCGKTTLLEIICGLSKPDSGIVKILGQDITQEKPANRQIGYIPQDTALFNHLSVEDNIAFALQLRKWNKDKIKDRINELATQLHIEHILDRSPRKLSGGEKQRVAIGRALAFQPDTLLLDEPLSALDQETRTSICDILEEIKNDTQVSCLHITHDQNESMRLADLVIKMDQGSIVDISEQ